MPLLLPVLRPVFETRDDGVPERSFSSLRFLLGGAFFVVAVPFFLGAGRFFEMLASFEASSVDGMGTEDSRSGEPVLMVLSCFSELTDFSIEPSMSEGTSEGRLVSVGDASLGVCAASCLM